MLISRDISELEESCATSLGPEREYPRESSKSKASRLRSESSLSLDLELDLFLLEPELDLDLFDFELFEECDLLDYLMDSEFGISLGSILTGLG